MLMIILHIYTVIQCTGYIIVLMLLHYKMWLTLLLLVNRGAHNSQNFMGYCLSYIFYNLSLILLYVSQKMSQGSV